MTDDEWREEFEARKRARAAGISVQADATRRQKERRSGVELFNKALAGFEAAQTQSSPRRKTLGEMEADQPEVRPRSKTAGKRRK